jgi:hypothetical protein
MSYDDELFPVVHSGKNDLANSSHLVGEVCCGGKSFGTGEVGCDDWVGKCFEFGLD